jgi:transposase
LHQAEAKQQLAVYYFDETGFTTVPCVPYAWQNSAETLCLPSQNSKRLNILGFLNKQNDSFFYGQEGNVTSQTIINAFEAFGQRYAGHYAKTQQPCVVILDNASVHTSKAFLAARENWCGYGVLVHYLPPYSPELNWIEILWRNIKYQWLSFDAYLSYAHLKAAVLEILAQVGKKYTITFA